MRARFTREATCFKTNIIIIHTPSYETTGIVRKDNVRVVSSAKNELVGLGEVHAKGLGRSPRVRFESGAFCVTLRLPFFSSFSGNKINFSYSNTGTKLILVEPVPQRVSTLAGGHSQNSSEYL